MRFKQLKASLENNAQTEPSIYMAVCLMETLIDDIEQESGLPLDECAEGDETLPTKLIWLCRTINSVYRTKESAFVRNKENLTKNLEKLRETEAALAGYAQTGQELADARKKLQQAEKKWKEAQAKHAEAAWSRSSNACRT